MLRPSNQILRNALGFLFPNILVTRPSDPFLRSQPRSGCQPLNEITGITGDHWCLAIESRPITQSLATQYIRSSPGTSRNIPLFTPQVSPPVFRWYLPHFLEDFPLFRHGDHYYHPTQHPSSIWSTPHHLHPGTQPQYLPLCIVLEMMRPLKSNNISGLPWMY